jgi:hypothetical protein
MGAPGYEIASDPVRVLIKAEPAVALLSFSTKGSGRGPMVNKVVEAMEIVRARAPELNADGELQADAAVDLVVGKSKAPGSKVAGRANTLVFPSLESANIGYKWWSGWAGRWPSDRFYKVWRSRPTIFPEAVRRKISSMSRWSPRCNRRRTDGTLGHVALPVGLPRTLRFAPRGARLSSQEISLAERPYAARPVRGAGRLRGA